MSTERDRALERAILGALRATIRDHGPITADMLTSATKRVMGGLKNVQLDQPSIAHLGGLARKEAGADFAKMGSRGGAAGKGVKKPRSPAAQRMTLARRLMRAMQLDGTIPAASMEHIAPNSAKPHALTSLDAAARALGVHIELVQLLKAERNRAQEALNSHPFPAAASIRAAATHARTLFTSEEIRLSDHDQARVLAMRLRSERPALALESLIAQVEEVFQEESSR